MSRVPLSSGGGVSGLVRKRAIAQRMLLLAALAVLLPALVLVTLIRMHGTTAERDGVRQALSTLPDSDRTVTAVYNIGSRFPADPTTRVAFLSATEQQVRAAFVGVDTSVIHETATVPYGVTGTGAATGTTSGAATGTTSGAGTGNTSGSGSQATYSVYFLGTNEATQYAHLISGTWPAAAPATVQPGTRTASGTEFEAAIPEVAAAANHWKVGDEVSTEARLDGAQQRFKIVGVYAPTDKTTSFWQAEAYKGAGKGQEDLPTFGPLLVDQSVTAGALLDIRQETVIAAPNFRTIQTSAAATLQNRLAALDAWLPNAATNVDSNIHASVLDQLAPQTQGIDSDLSISSRLNLLPVVELGLLALTALVLTTRLLSEHRRESDGLLRARGASVAGLLRVGLAEGLLLTLPVAAVSPFAARFLERGLSSSHWSSARDSAPPISSDLWVVVSIGALATLLLLALVPVTSSASFVGVKRERSRSQARTAVQRTGADVIVVLLGAGAFWELTRFGNDPSHNGPLSMPQVVAPSVLLLAGSLVLLRALPLIVGPLEYLAARRRAAVLALAGWRIGRTARTYAAPMALLIMAVAVGTQATVFLASANRSADDQGTHLVGADVRAAGIPGGHLGAAGSLAAVPGAGGGFAAARESLFFGSGLQQLPINVLGIDPAKSANVVDLRSDLAGKSWPRLSAQLASQGWDADGMSGGVPLPGKPTKLTLDVRYQGQALDPSVPGSLGSLDVQAEVVDRYGVGAVVDFGGVQAADGQTHTLSAQVDAEGGAIAYPLRITALSVAYHAPLCLSYDSAGNPVPNCSIAAGGKGDPETATVDVGDLTADGAPAALPAGVQAHAFGEPLQAGASNTSDNDVSPAGYQVDQTSGSALVHFTEFSGFGTDTAPIVTHTLDLARSSAALTDVPVLASTQLLTTLGLKVGDTYTTSAFGAPVRVHFVGTVKAMPAPYRLGQRAAGAPAEDAAVVVPIGFLDRADLASRAINEQTEWWAKAAEGTTPAQLAARYRAVHNSALVSAPIVTDRSSQAALIRDDPVRSAMMLTLVIAAGAALLFILIGFALHSVIALRERTTELALLNALGLSRRRTAVMLLAENLLLVVLGMVGGAALAVLTIRSELPLLILTDSGQVPIPKPVTVVDLPALAGVGAVAAVLLLGLVALVSLTRRTADTGGTLRLGEDGR
ncbi:ABC transporter permease [Catenulispora pinisilvae]|uniref:ABC transporter permease n=1 Tax=Catenulispora pinisilvae TaxID=2705253 RepID=UPI001891DCB8|nr:FtsX-like permease family protein [Catenulispora pinisilvae]